jgi:hypothetical protein
VLKRVKYGDDVYVDQWRRECDLAFRWQHLGDQEALAELVGSFKGLLYGVAGERYIACQLDKGTKVSNPTVAAKHRDISGNFDELLSAGLLGLVEAAGLYKGCGPDGRPARFATFARDRVFKRAQEYVRLNWNVVLQPEPARWKVAKADQIPRTYPNPGMNSSRTRSVSIGSQRRRGT